MSHANEADERLKEQTFFADPAIDRVMAFAFTLATENWVLRDRVSCLEALLVGKGVLKAGELDAFKPDDGVARAIDGDRNEYIHHLMNNLIGLQASKGAPSDLMQRFG